jgi:hypothetical protein
MLPWMDLRPLLVRNKKRLRLRMDAGLAACQVALVKHWYIHRLYIVYYVSQWPTKRARPLMSLDPSTDASMRMAHMDLNHHLTSPLLLILHHYHMETKGSVCLAAELREALVTQEGVGWIVSPGSVGLWNWSWQDQQAARHNKCVGECQNDVVMSAYGQPRLLIAYDG